MPRIYESTGAAPDSGEDLSIPMDYCNRCYGAAKRAAGPEDEVDQDHPPYDECGYPCETCGKTLTERDD